MDIQNLLINSYKLRPEMEIRDYVKLLYQSEFGGGHMIPDESASLTRLEKEWNEAPPDAGTPAIEPIGGFCRVNLAGAKASGMNVSTVHRAFLLSSASAKGSTAGFEEKLSVLSDCAERGLLPIALRELSAFMAGYRQAGYPPMRHSDTYREKYRPAYRLAGRTFAEFFPLLCRIDRLLSQKPRVVLIDGMCASGKSALAEYLRVLYGAAVVHTDDFFLRPGQRTPARMAEPGGNIDYQRFALEAAPGIALGGPFAYRAFDCKTGGYSEISVSPSPLTVVEGAYSLHPRMGLLPDIRVFMKLDPREQSLRILQRNGEKMHRRFIGEWVPKENRYFEAFGVEQNCDFIFDTSIAKR